MVSTSTIINIFNPPFPQSAQTSNNSAIKSFKKKAANIVINGIQHIKHKKFPINISNNNLISLLKDKLRFHALSIPYIRHPLQHNNSNLP